VIARNRRNRERQNALFLCVSKVLPFNSGVLAILAIPNQRSSAARFCDRAEQASFALLALSVLIFLSHLQDEI
jgi:hypothetical protein